MRLCIGVSHEQEMSAPYISEEENEEQPTHTRASQKCSFLEERGRELFIILCVPSWTYFPWKWQGVEGQKLNPRNSHMSRLTVKCDYDSIVSLGCTVLLNSYLEGRLDQLPFILTYKQLIMYHFNQQTINDIILAIEQKSLILVNDVH